MNDKYVQEIVTDCRARCIDMNPTEEIVFLQDVIDRLQNRIEELADKVDEQRDHGP